MKITYIYQSCYILQDGGTAFIFDYYVAPGAAGKAIVDEVLKSVKKLYVFVSHSHGDHYDKSIFNWGKIVPDITYILSDDISAKQAEKIVSLKKSEIYNDDVVFVKAFGSTDQGISFFIKYDEKLIFHAGDLNNWHWKNEVTDKEALGFEKFYLDELSEIKKDISYLDIAMFPVDPRMEIDFDRGAKQFIDTIEVKYFFPMHFMGNFEALNGMEAYAGQNGTRFIRWGNFGESFEF
jgi:L-ascorbate metabolism protein UlaG (beta-lactamase superfamily)